VEEGVSGVVYGHLSRQRSAKFNTIYKSVTERTRDKRVYTMPHVTNISGPGNILYRYVRCFTYPDTSTSGII